MLTTHKPIPFVIALEGYNLCYILLLFINRANRHTLKRLLLLSMLILSIMMFGVCLLQIQPTSIVGKSLILIGLLFKLGVFPFHTWVLEVYENVSFRIIAITDSIMKPMLAIIFVKILPNINTELLPILHALGYLSLIFGSLLALHEHNIKRWIGSLSIGHIGIIMCVASTTSVLPSNATMATLLYIIAYSSCTVVFCISKNNILKVITLCGMVGLPPFYTFFAKINLITELLNSTDMYALLAIMLYFVVELTSIIRWLIHYFYKFILKSDGSVIVS